jgi:nitroreductase
MLPFTLLCTFWRHGRSPGKVFSTNFIGELRIEKDKKMQTTKIELKADPKIYKRYSPREFDDTVVDEEILLTLFEAARWAPSSSNEQPWRFIYGTKTNSSTFEKLYSCLSASNQEWAGGAPVLMLSIAKTYFDKDKSKNRHAFHDVGLAMGNLLNQATIQNLKVHQMAGFDKDKAKETFELPDGFEPVAMVALGYSSAIKKNRSRNAIEEFAFDDAFGS